MNCSIQTVLNAASEGELESRFGHKKIRYEFF